LGKTEEEDRNDNQMEFAELEKSHKTKLEAKRKKDHKMWNSV